MTTRLTRLEEKLARLEQKEFTSKKKKPFKLPWKVKRVIKKKPTFVVTQYLTQDREIRFQRCKIISGNIIIVNNKVHELNPKYLWRFGKQFWYIHREIDRKPVSNEDYDAVKSRRDDTEADVPLIKAVLGAIHKPNPLQSKNIWIILGIALVVGVILFTFL